jgi:MFS transporter, putative metabolite:H+ symporter
MAAQTQVTLRPGHVLARQDRLLVWALPGVFLAIIGGGYLFTFYDIFDINVSFIQTCTQIVSNCTPATASNYLATPVLLSLVGYMVGAVLLTPLADRFGRRNILLVTLIITGLGSLYTAFTHDLISFEISRFITGAGIGADLAIVNTYVTEVAPKNGRAKYTSFIFIMSALGAFLGIWLGLVLTTPKADFPLGLPFAQAGEASGTFIDGWRIMYGVGALLALIGILLRAQLPESPRWLIFRGRVEEADKIVSAMEQRVSKRQSLPMVGADIPVDQQDKQVGFIDILANPLYLRRELLVTAVWVFAYVTVYTIGSGFTTVLASLKYVPPEAGLIAAFGTFGFIACAIFAYFFGERLERKVWLPIGAAVTLLGGMLLGFAGQAGLPTQTPIIAFIGAIILFFGFNLWVPMTYTWSTENFPTRARTTGYGIADGVGHVGGGLGLLIIVPLLSHLGPIPAFLLICSFLIIAAIIVQFGVSTGNETLEKVSP